MPDYTLLKLFFLDPKAEVLAIRARAIALIKDGKTIMDVGSGGSSTRKQFTMAADRIVFECNAALKFIDPATYGARRRKSYSCVTNRGQ